MGLSPTGILVSQRRHKEKHRTISLFFREWLPGLERLRVERQPPPQLHRGAQLVQRVRSLLPRPHRRHGRHQHERGPPQSLPGHLGGDALSRRGRVSGKRESINIFVGVALKFPSRHLNDPPLCPSSSLIFFCLRRPLFLFVPPPPLAFLASLPPSSGKRGEVDSSRRSDTARGARGRSRRAGGN